MELQTQRDPPAPDSPILAGQRFCPLWFLYGSSHRPQPEKGGAQNLGLLCPKNGLLWGCIVACYFALLGFPGTFNQFWATLGHSAPVVLGYWAFHCRAQLPPAIQHGPIRGPTKLWRTLTQALLDPYLGVGGVWLL